MTRLVLASSSPRRLALLAQVGVAVESVSPEIDETPLQHETPGRYARRMALSKVRAVDARLTGQPAILMAADTVVAIDGEVLGQPQDGEQAQRMLHRLSGREHSVFSAVAVGPVDGAFACKLAETRVWMRATTRAEREAYWATSEPLGKAGGYAIQGIGAVFVERIEGNYATVVGLPIVELMTMLAAHGVTVPPLTGDENA
ncbi:MAG: nucleoside triphosphate pyrophosphatase [Pseudomonadota bacterium]